MIHSRSHSFDEVKEFIGHYNEFENRKPLVVAPSSFPSIYEEELVKHQVNVVIYANQLLRAAYPAMLNTAVSILQHHRAKEASDTYCMPIKDIINLIPG
jgi:phosphoenolpyruvate phosphomutase